MPIALSAESQFSLERFFSWENKARENFHLSDGCHSSGTSRCRYGAITLNAQDAAWELGPETHMSIVFKQSDGISFINLEGAIAIPDAAELKLAILQALTSGQPLSFDLQNATELDITALQLLWAAEREAEIAGLPSTISGRVPEGIQLAAINAGFPKFPMDSK